MLQIFKELQSGEWEKDVAFYDNGQYLDLADGDLKGVLESIPTDDPPVTDPRTVAVLSFVDITDAESPDLSWLDNLNSLVEWIQAQNLENDVLVAAILYKHSSTADDFDYLDAHGTMSDAAAFATIRTDDWNASGALAPAFFSGLTPTVDPPFTYILHRSGTDHYRVVDKFHGTSADNGDGFFGSLPMAPNAAEDLITLGTPGPGFADLEELCKRRILDHMDDSPCVELELADSAVANPGFIWNDSTLTFHFSEKPVFLRDQNTFRVVEIQNVGDLTGPPVAGVLGTFIRLTTDLTNHAATDALGQFELIEECTITFTGLEDHYGKTLKLEINDGAANPLADYVGNAFGFCPDEDLEFEVAAPDLYLRDNPADVGEPHLLGNLWKSPDIFVVHDDLQGSPMDLQAAYGEGSPNQDADELGAEYQVGGDNYLICRARNRGALPVAAATASVDAYYTFPSSLSAPNDWTFAGNVPFSRDIPANEHLIVSDELNWNANNPPQLQGPDDDGHRCLIGVIGIDMGPGPAVPGEEMYSQADLIAKMSSHGSFSNLIRNENNLAWRNFRIVELPVGGGGGAPAPLPLPPLPFDFNGWFKKPARMRLILGGFLPKGTEMAAVGPEPVFKPVLPFIQPWLKRRGYAKTGPAAKDRKLTRVDFTVLRNRFEERFPPIAAEPGSRHRLTLEVILPGKLALRPYIIYASQRIGRFEVGRFTWEIRPRWIGKDSKEA